MLDADANTTTPLAAARALVRAAVFITIIAATAAASSCPESTAVSSTVNGAPVCLVDAGYYFDGAKPSGQQRIVCPANRFCTGGRIDQSAGRTAVSCAAGRGTLSTGATKASDCATIRPGYYLDASNVAILCPPNSFCRGRASESGPSVAVSCPSGTASAAGASACMVPPGSFFDGTTTRPCPANSYCFGGRTDGRGAQTLPCPWGGVVAEGLGTRRSDCKPRSGFYFDASMAVKPCTAHHYCTGWSSATRSATQTPCPSGTTTKGVGKSNVSHCFVAAGAFYDDTSKSAKPCPPDAWCPGGRATETVVNNCPAGSGTDNLQAGSRGTRSACKLKPGRYCKMVDGACSITECESGYVCEGGNSIEEAPQSATAHGRTSVPCPGSSTQNGPCPVDCELSEWTDTSTCQPSGTKTQTRTVVTPAKYGGAACPGSLAQNVPCPVDCVLSDWTDASSCVEQGLPT